MILITDSHLNIQRVEFPVNIPGQTGHVNTLGDVDGVRQLVDVLERALDAVKDGAEDTRPQLHGEGLAGTEHGVSHGYA